MNGRQTNFAEVVRTLLPARPLPGETLDTLMLLAVSRRPTAEERAKLAPAIQAAPTPAEGAADLLWALVNSSEFTMVR